MKIKKNNLIKNAINGYEVLKKQSELSKLDNIKIEFLKINFNLEKSYFKNKAFQNNIPSINIVCKQFLYFNLIKVDFNIEVLSSINLDKKISYPLPTIWQDVILDHGIKINRFKCSLLWNIFLFKNFLFGFKNAIKFCIKSIISLPRKDDRFNNNYNVCFDLNKLALEFDNNKKSNNFLKWYINHFNNNNNFSTLFHQVEYKENKKIIDNLIIEFNKNYIPYLNIISHIFSYFMQCIYFFIVAFFKLISGKWENMLLFNETIQYLQVKYANKNRLARNYLFNNSIGIYRPLWTYEAEKKGSNIIFYFYSIPSYHKLFSNSINDTLIESLKLQTWNIYYLWNQFHCKTLKYNINYKASFYITGPIVFGKPFFNLSQHYKTIALFDIQSFNDSKYKLFSISEEYYIPEIAIKFLSDIKEVAKLLDYKIVYKRKRNIGNEIHPKLLEYINNDFIDNKYIIQIDTDISAYDIIYNTVGSISMPFTSTAFIGKHVLKPAIFYDPTGYISKSNNNADDILILTNIEELKSWVSNL
jgi:polysaccharide biosynthesis PFTS motif protein